MFDGLVWGQLESTGKMPKTDITVERPFWSGTFWAVFPKQAQMPGTNSRSNGEAELRMLWTAPTLDAVNNYYRSPAASDWLKRANGGSANLANAFAQSPRQIVVVDEKATDPIFVEGSRMADRIAAAIASTDLSGALPQAGTPGPAHLPR